MKRKMHVFAIDPGLTSTGWSYMEYNIETGKVKVKDIGQIDGDDISKELPYKNEVKLFEKKLVKLERLYNTIASLMESREIDYVVCESAFLRGRNVQAYAVLVLCIDAIKRAAKHILRLPVATIAPTLVKSTISNYGFSDKVAIQDAIIACEDIELPSKLVDVHKLTEHMSDSIAIGYAFVKHNVSIW